MYLVHLLLRLEDGPLPLPLAVAVLALALALTILALAILAAALAAEVAEARPARHIGVVGLVVSASARVGPHGRPWASRPLGYRAQRLG